MRSRSSSRATPRPSPQPSPNPSPHPSPQLAALSSPEPSPTSSANSANSSYSPTSSHSFSAALPPLAPLSIGDMPPSASIAPASHFNYASPPSRRVKGVFKAPATPSSTSVQSAVAAHAASSGLSYAAPQPLRRHAKASPLPTPHTLHDSPVPDGATHPRSGSLSHSGRSLPRFHMADFSDSSPSVSPNVSPSDSPRDRWHKQANGVLLSPKPPSPPLNHTNTFHRVPTPYIATPPVPPPLLSSPTSLVSRRSLNQSMAVMTAENSRDASHRDVKVIVTKGGSSVAVTVPPSPPPPSPSSSVRHAHANHVVPSFHKASSVPPHTLAPPTLPSPTHQTRTVSSPVVIHSIPSATPALSYPPALSPSSSALALLHASHVFVKSSASLLSRWQKRWLMLTQHRAPPYYRLTLYAQPGQSDPLDTLNISTTSTVTGSIDKRKQCRLCICADGKELIVDCLDVAEKTTWNLALQQAALLTHHSASAMSPTALRALSFPPSQTAAASANALTSWQQYFFHLYYALPEVGYVHSHYDAAMVKFKERFIDEEAIVRFLLSSVNEEVRRDNNKPTDHNVPQDDGSGAIYVNESAITAYLSAKFGATSLPSQLLTHALAATVQSTAPQPSLHPVPFSHTSTNPPPVVIDPINQSQLLTLPNPTVPASPSAGQLKQRFEQRLHSPGTLHHLSTLLLSSSRALSALAFRLLWLIVGNVYPPSLTSNIVQLYLASLTPTARGSSEMIASMRCLLFAQSIAQDTAGLRSSFLRPFVLPCLLSSLAFSPFSLRESTLKDVSACLLQQPNNIMAFASLPQWQTLLLALLTDIHYDVVKDIGGMDRREVSDGEEIESVTVGGESVGRIVWHEDVTMRADYQLQRSVYSYVHNMFAIVHYRAFLTVPSASSPSASSPLSFTSVLCSTLDSLFTFAGPRITTQRTAFLMLSTLLNLIDANVTKRAVLYSSDTHSADWRNLSALLSILRAYTFHCHHWIATDSDTHTYLAAQSNIRMVLYQCKFRHPSFIPFHSLLDSKPVTLDTVGVHFDEEGAAADLPLVKRVLGILEAVRVDAPSDATVHFRGCSEDDRMYLLSLYHYYVFFESSFDFLAGLQERLQMDDTINIRKLREAVVAFMEAEDAKMKRDAVTNKKLNKLPRKDSPRSSVVSDDRSNRLKTEMSRTVTASAPRDSPLQPYGTPTSKRLSITRRSEQEDRYRSPAGVRRQLHSELAKEKSTTIGSHISLPQHTPPTPDSPTHSNASSNVESAQHKRGSSDSLKTELYSKLSTRAEVQLARECSEETLVGQRQGSYVSTEKSADSDEDRSVNDEERSGSRGHKDSWSVNGAGGGDGDGLQIVLPTTP